MASPVALLYVAAVGAFLWAAGELPSRSGG